MVVVKRNAADDENILLCSCYRVSRRFFALNVRSYRGVKVGEIDCLKVDKMEDISPHKKG
jgi:hypothetical protein